MSDAQQFIARKDEIRALLLACTGIAFYTIPALDRPHILDIDCGEGIAALEFARLSGGTITGIDIDKKALLKLNEKARNHQRKKDCFTEGDKF